MTEAQFPTKTAEDKFGLGEEYQHPAFGVAVLTSVSGHKSALFGSDIEHNGVIRIALHEASLKRNLYRDWVYPGDVIVDFEMSHAQFAQLISSPGKGDGTPVTITWLRGVGAVPGIKKIQSKHDLHRKEIADNVREANSRLVEQVKALEAMIESGKVGKRELREIVKNLSIQLANQPSNLSFAVQSAEEALEKATSDAKIEVEAYIGATAQRLGLKQIADLARLENKQDDSDA